MLSGLKDRLMAPEMVAEAIRAYVAEVMVIISAPLPSDH